MTSLDDEPILRELATILRQPGALEAVRSLVDAQVELDSAIECPPMVSVTAGDPALVMVIECARRREEQRETDMPASRCAWLDAPEIGGYRCKVCGRAEVGTERARRLDQVRGVRDGA